MVKTTKKSTTNKTNVKTKKVIAKKTNNTKPVVKKVCNKTACKCTAKPTKVSINSVKTEETKKPVKKTFSQKIKEFFGF